MWVFGGLIEPGGMELSDEHREVLCRACGMPADRHLFERLDAGCINSYEHIVCGSCGHEEGDDGTP